MTPELLYLYGKTAMHSAIQSEARKTTAIPMAPVVIDNQDRKMQSGHTSDDQEKHEGDGQETGDLLPLPSPRTKEKREEVAELWDGSEDEVHGSDEGDVEVRIGT